MQRNSWLWGATGDQMESLPEKLISGILSGRAMLFAGAGFSMGSKAKSSKIIPDAKALANNICSLGSFSPSDSLKYAADRYLSKEDNKPTLVDFLKNYYIIDTAEIYIKSICHLPWKCIYTTNYDNLIEIASMGCTKKVVPVDMETDAYSNCFKNDKKCVHINGYIKNLRSDNINTTFKISESSYCTPEGFLTSPWYTIFKRDVERCASIVFIGYSLYDIDIKRILVSIDGLVDRTYFITRENPSEEDSFTLSQLGHVIPCGVKKFGEEIEKISIIDSCSLPSLNCLKKYIPIDKPITATDDDIESMLMLGTVSLELVENSIFHDSSPSYVIKRTTLGTIESLLKHSNVILLGELGNGKSIILYELLPWLSLKHPNIYFLDDSSGDIVSDIENILEAGDTAVVICDDYCSFVDVFAHYPLFDKSKIKFVLSSRTTTHERYKHKLAEYGFCYSEFEVDMLNDEEISDVVSLVSSVGMWGDYRDAPRSKQVIVKNDCRSQISLLLVSLLRSPDIQNRFKKLIGVLLDSSSETMRKTVLATAFLGSLDIPVDTALISEIAGNDIYDAKLKTNEFFCNIFKFKQNGVLVKSSLFCQMLIKNYFAAEETRNFLLKIAESFNSKQRFSIAHEIIFKSVLRFSFVERLLPDETKKRNLSMYYENLKRNVPWLISDPHFWLQYGMTKIACEDFDKAQRYFDNAYSEARKKTNYYTSPIDTQQARLNILLSLRAESTLESMSLFQKGHKIILTLPNDRYKYRQIDLYEEFYNRRFNFLDEDWKKKFLSFCREVAGNLRTAHQEVESMKLDNHSRVLRLIQKLLDKNPQ